jgi:hypothetical protein
VRGVLYAGTETGAYYSMDNGAKWMPFSGMPKVPVTDLEVRHGDLIAATEGRAFWILDDIAPMRQHTAEVAGAESHLYEPRAAILSQTGGGGGGGGAAARVGANPPSGAVIQYRLARSDSTTRVTIEILNAAGTVLRTFTSGGTGPGARPSTRAGINRFVWDLRYAGPTTLPNVTLFGSPGGGAGPRVTPGRYQVRMKVGAVSQTRPLEVQADPRLAPIAPAVLAQRDSIARLLSDRISEMSNAVLRLRDFKVQVGGIITRTATHEMADTIATNGRGVTSTIDGLEPRLTTKAANGQDIINYANGINGQFGFLLGQVEGHPELTTMVRERMVEVDAQWAALRAQLEAFEANELAAFNRLLDRAGVPGVIIPTPKRPAPIM